MTARRLGATCTQGEQNNYHPHYALPCNVLVLVSFIFAVLPRVAVALDGVRVSSAVRKRVACRAQAHFNTRRTGESVNPT